MDKNMVEYMISEKRIITDIEVYEQTLKQTLQHCDCETVPELLSHLEEELSDAGNICLEHYGKGHPRSFYVGCHILKYLKKVTENGVESIDELQKGILSILCTNDFTAARKEQVC